MKEIPIPSGPEGLSAEWFTSALQSSRVLPPGVSVSSFVSTMIGEGKGFTGRVLRVELDYDQETRAPTSLIAKFPPASRESREALHDYRVYEIEVCFYRDLADSVVFRIPESYYADLNLETGEGVLLLEDLTPAHPFNLIAGVPPERARRTVGELAAHHAQWWGCNRLSRYGWLRPFDERAAYRQQKYQAALPSFLDKMGGQLPLQLVDLAKRMRDRIVWIRQQIASEPTTFLHGDFHPNNLFIKQEEGGERLSVVDWQLCSRGRCTRDLVYFVTSALTPENRRLHEKEILSTYHRELVAQGVENFSLGDVVDGYRFALLDLMFFFVMVIDLLDFEVNEEARAIRDLLCARWGGAILEHDPGALLPGEAGRGAA